MQRFIAGLGALGLLLFSPMVWAAGPSVDQVYQAAKAGDLAGAQRMMAEVLQQHPHSAQAHYVESRLLAQQGRWQDAATQLQEAQRLAPGLPFVKVADAQAFAKQVAAHQGRATPAWLRMLAVALGAGLLFWLITAFFRRRRPVQSMPYGGNNPSAFGGPMGGGGYGPGNMGGPQAGPGLGSGLASGLATGVGIGAGLAAGEALAGSLFGHKDGAAADPAANPAADSDFGMNNDSWGANDQLASNQDDGFGFDGGDDGSWG